MSFNRILMRIAGILRRVDVHDLSAYQEVFDTSWYLEHYPDVAAAGVNPIAHYLCFGASEGRDPSPLFDTSWYLENNPDVADAGMNPLAHYLRFGASEGRDPSPLFDTSSYLKHNPEATAAGVNPLVHYVSKGAAENSRLRAVEMGRPPEPCPQGDVAEARLRRHNSLRQIENDAELIRTCGLFDEAYYLAHNPDVAAAGLDPARHYAEHGFREGRRASSLFDGMRYVEENPDVKSTGMNPLLHWVRYGVKEGRNAPFTILDSGDGLALRDLCDPNARELPSIQPEAGFLVSILTPTYNTRPVFLRELFQTLRNQTYSGWEWIVVDDGSMRAQTVRILREIEQEDPRVRVIFSRTNAGISASSNTALEAARGQYVALVDHDDLLARDALASVWRAWRNARDTKLFYTDECKLSETGRIYDLALKPDFSPALLENTMYIGHLAVYDRDFVTAIGGFRARFDGTQDYDLALRAAAQTSAIRHVDAVAYLWRAIKGSAALALDAKNYAIVRQGVAVLEHAKQLHPDAVVRPGFSPGYWRVDYPLPTDPPLISFVIPTAGGSRMIRGRRTDLIINCIQSFEDHRFCGRSEFVVVHNGDLSHEQMAFLYGKDNVRLVHYASPIFNLSEKLNLGAKHAHGDYLCLLNDDVEAITEGGGDQIIGFMEAHVQAGAVSTLCLFEDGRVQHNGIVLLEDGPSHYGLLKRPEFGGHSNFLLCRREVFGVTGAILFVRRAIYEELGGFSESLPLNYNDVDFCLRLRERGLFCVVDPKVVVYHYESTSKLGTFTCEKESLMARHPGLRDPYFNKGFDQRSPYLALPHPTDVEVRGADPEAFEAWLDRRIAARVHQFSPQGSPKLSVVVPVYNQPQRLLEEMYQSFMMQTYAHKELVIVDDGSTNPETLDWLKRIRGEKRALVIRHEVNRGINGANRTLLAASTGDFLMPMDADDFITIDALQVMAYFVSKNPEGKIFYSDEFKSNPTSDKFAPFFKPDFDPILLMNCCYPAHLMALKRDFLLSIRAYDDDRATWSHDYDSLTRALAVGEEPIHVPELLYAWRIHPGSTASIQTSTKRDTVLSQHFVLDRLLYARGLAGTLQVTQNSLFPHDGMWRLEAHRPVEGIEIVGARDVWGTDPPELLQRLNAASRSGSRWVAILLSPNETELTLRELSAPAHFEPRVAVVGGILTDRTDTIVEWSGGFFGAGGALVDAYAGGPFTDSGYHGQLYCQRCIDVPPPADVLIRSDLLARVLSHIGAPVDLDSVLMSLALEIHQEGLFAVTTPHVRRPLPADWSLPLPLDRHGILARKVPLPISRWYNPILRCEQPYMFPQNSTTNFACDCSSTDLVRSVSNTVEHAARSKKELICAESTPQ